MQIMPGWQQEQYLHMAKIAGEIVVRQIEDSKRRSMTKEEAEEQRRSFAYGNANIDNPNVTREMINKAADQNTVNTRLSPDTKEQS